jgi:hypothetical protein
MPNALCVFLRGSEGEFPEGLPTGNGWTAYVRRYPFQICLQRMRSEEEV